MNVSHEQVRFFREEGYLHLPNCFESRGLEEIADHVMNLRQPPESERERFGEYPFRGFIGRKRFVDFTDAERRSSERLMRIHSFDRRYLELMLSPRLFTLAEDLLGGEVVAFHSAFIAKPPRAQGIMAHVDNLYFNIYPPRVVGIQLLVDDVDKENGGLQVAPKTHRIPWEQPVQFSREESVPSEEQPAPQGTEWITVSGQPGDAICFDGLLLHASQQNCSATRWRRTPIFHYASAEISAAPLSCQPLYRRDGSSFRLETKAS